MASIALVAGWMYALIAFGVGWASRSKREAALTALATLVVAVVAYYGTKAAQGGFRVPDFDDPANADGFFAWNEFLSVIVVWCAFAVLLGRSAHSPATSPAPGPAPFGRSCGCPAGSWSRPWPSSRPPFG
ncbi:hypothetical protein ACFTWH_16890 [Streptomyces sp. NPDC057011]|uniref:hypothetical protein n=1 Tax=unclassified Streptomyces TaxID=2593676 RepID=UPI0036355A33